MSDKWKIVYLPSGNSVEGTEAEMRNVMQTAPVPLGNAEIVLYDPAGNEIEREDAL
jgi:hypothetical protein